MYNKSIKGSQYLIQTLYLLSNLLPESLTGSFLFFIKNDNTLPFIGEAEGYKKILILLNKDAALGSQFTVDEGFTSQEINGELVYVEELEPASIFKWDKTEGNHGYYIVSRTSDKSATFVDHTLYYTQNAPFGSMAARAIRSKYKGLFTELSPEVDDEGEFHYVASTYKQGGPNGLPVVTGVVILDAEDPNGNVQFYDMENIPDWVERVYPESFFEQYCDIYGAYVNGIWNTVFAHRGMEKTTDGLDVVYINDDCYFYTGWTSYGSENSSSGIMMMNTRTGEMNLYRTGGGIDETYAMEVINGVTQNFGYTAGYPLIISEAGEPTMFMLVRDDSNNLAGYGFVSYTDSNKKAYASTLKDAETAYLKALNKNPSNAVINGGDVTYTEGKIAKIATEVVEGNTAYYIMLDGEKQIFRFYSELEPYIVFAKEGDEIRIGYIKTDDTVINAVEAKLKE